jgi:divalent metal cation (Fe/Co/Zn/Cd) transporter
MAPNSVSDWLSAICNVFIAGAAVYAAFNVKDLMKDKTHTAGLQKAESLVSEIDLLHLTVTKMIEDISDLNLNIEFKGFEHDSQLNNDKLLAAKIRENVNGLKMKLDTVFINFKSLRRWNIEIVKKTELELIFNNYNEIIVLCENSVMNCLSLLDYYCAVGIENNITDTFISKFNSNYQDLLNTKFIVDDLYKEFTVFSFSDVFSVNKN